MTRSLMMLLLLTVTMTLPLTAGAQNAATVLEKLNTYLPAAPREGNFYAGITTTGKPCEVQASFDVNTYFVNVKLDPASTGVSYHLMIQPTRFEATPLVGQREVPGRAIQYASRYLTTPASVTSTLPHPTPVSTDENIMVLKENDAIRMVTVNQQSCANLRLVRTPPPVPGSLTMRRWEDYNHHGR